MSYPIRLTNNTLLTTVQDGTIDQSTTILTLVGRNYTGYGGYLNSDLVHILENSNNTTAPTTPLTGQLWWDSAGNLKAFNGTQWNTLSSITSSSTLPTGSVTGNQWWNTSAQQLSVYNGSGWTLVGPAFSPTGPLTGLVAETLPNPVLTVYSNGTRIAILSNASTFTPNTTVSGFSTINPGITLSSDTSNISGAQYWGTATNSLALGGLTASGYAQLTGASFSGTVTVNTLAVNNAATLSSTLNVTGNITGTSLTLSDSQVITRNLQALGGLQATPIGNATTSSGAFTTVSASGNVTAAGLTSTGTITAAGTISGSALTLGTPLSVSNGGFGSSSLTSNAILLGNGTSAVQVVSPGTSGNVLVSTGTTWQSQTLNLAYVPIATRVDTGAGLVGGGQLSSSLSIALASGSNGYGVRTISLNPPSGGSDGDIWYQVAS